jgi:cytochrome c biogenesis protein CcmG/thiol:disulfide interchange protein DsbE
MADTASTRPRLKPIFLLPVIVFAALAVLFITRLTPGSDPSRVPSALIGRPAPAFDLAPLEGLMANGAPVPGLAQADLKGRTTIVNIFASWCAPCREEHPLLMELAKDPNVRVVGINMKDDPDNARRFLGALGNPFSAVGVDPKGRAGIEWGVYGVPETFIVGPDGTIRHKQIGPLTPDTIGRFRERLNIKTGAP